ncbi:MAG: MFS transporter [Thermoplasmata archaeon]|jgi:PHS family inorganic phosphate transporter-like MFS transporter
MVEKNGIFSDIDSVRLNFGHIKVWFTAGMGFFTDAYDLFIIGIVLILLTGPYSVSFHINTIEASLLGSSAIVAAIIGQLVFGAIADRFGRKRVYGIEATLLAVGAILSAISTNFLELFIFRFVLGLGIGGDYPVSATIMSEYSNTKDRGKLLALLFANQGIGSVTAVAVGIASAVLLPPDLAWRVMLLFGAIPAIAVIYLRRKLPETPRYSLLVNNDKDTAKRAKEVVGGSQSINPVKVEKHPFRVFLKNYGNILFVTSSTWFLMDIAFYGTGIYSGPIVSNIISASTLPMKVFLAGVPFLVGFFGYFSAVALIDKIGRKKLQILGFIAMSFLYFLISTLMIVKGTKVEGFTIPIDLAFILYSLTFFFIDLGPNTTTFIVPAEVFPVHYRTTSHGISAASGKLGAAISTLLFPTLLIVIGLKTLLTILALIALIGAFISIWLPEPKNVPLEEIAREKIIEENASQV